MEEKVLFLVSEMTDDVMASLSCFVNDDHLQSDFLTIRSTQDTTLQTD